MSILAQGSPAREPAALALTFAEGFGEPALFNNMYRVEYLRDMLAHPDRATPVFTNGETAVGSQHPFRQALVKNDLRGWTPKAPIAMCGGNGDPATPFRLGAELMQVYWSKPGTAAPAGVVSVFDVDSTPTANDPYAALKTDFAKAKAQVLASNGQAGLLNAYHGLVQRYCNTAARFLFDSLK